MKILFTFTMAVLLASTGCTIDHDHERSTVIVQTLSDQHADGDIGFSPYPQPSGTYIISQANDTGNIVFGIDADGTEYRAFLDFPLDGSTGGEVVPVEATIVSAVIEVFVNDVSLSSTVPTLLDLVPFPITGLSADDYNSQPIATRSSMNFFRSDVDRYVRIDVTSLMVEAQYQGFQDFQIRFLLDFVDGASGLVEIDDGSSDQAPQLTVEFR